MNTLSFFQTHSVFTLEEAVVGLAPRGGRKGAIERLKYAARRGRIRMVARGVYASVPPGLDAALFEPDRYLVAAAIRPDGVFSHHAALELLGAAHSEWSLCTLYTRRRRALLALGDVELRFLAHPTALNRKGLSTLGVRTVLRADRKLLVTGPERTLLDGFRKPDLAGGLAELVESAAGLPVLELPLLHELLEAYDRKLLWAAAGWFTETWRRTFFVGEDDLKLFERHVPKSPLYLGGQSPDGRLVRRWNLIVPSNVLAMAGPDEP